MKWFSVAASVVIIAAMAVGVSKTSESAARAPVNAPCSASALADAYHGTDKVRSVNSFGCEGRWAYLWATIGTGVQEIGVTDVLRFDEATNAWKNASRLTYCMHDLLPRYVEYWGCNSN
jgi:hypothetical protein